MVVDEIDKTNDSASFTRILIFTYALIGDPGAGEWWNPSSLVSPRQDWNMNISITKIPNLQFENHDLPGKWTTLASLPF